MVDPLATRRSLFQLLLAGLAALVIFLQVLPLGLGASRVPSPDLVMLLMAAWALRRPDYVPTLLVAAVLLLADILFVRPPGLWAGIGVIGIEALRRRGETVSDLSFVAEWALVAGVLAAMTLAETLVLAVLLVPQPPVSASALQLLISVAIYPSVVFATICVFGVRPATPAERDARALRT